MQLAQNLRQHLAGHMQQRGFVKHAVKALRR